MMNDLSLSRRGFIGSTTLVAGATLGPVVSAQKSDGISERFRFGLNMSTIRGQKLSAAQEIEVAAEAGYDAIES